MKNLIRVLMVSVVMIGAALSAQAQQKFGHINSQDIFYSMPEIKTVQAQLEAKSKEYQNQLNAMYTQYEALVTEIQNNGSSWMQAVLEAKYKELFDLEEKIIAKEEQAQKDIIELEGNLLAPIEQKAYNAIQTVAATNGYAYIIDSSMGSFIILPDGDDLTNMVKSELGISY